MPKSPRALRKSVQPPVPEKRVLSFLKTLFADDLHAARIASLSHATVGVLVAGVLGVAAIGKGLAAARSIETKSGIKQVDRLLSNRGIVLDKLLPRWVAFVLRDTEEAWINLDWTDADADDQTTLMASLQERGGRSTPLMWMTVRKSELKGKKFEHVHTLLGKLRSALPSNVRRAYIVADREFGNTTMYRMLDELKFGYVLRFRQDINVTSWDGETRKAADWQRATGKLRSMISASVTVDGHRVGKVVVVRDKNMKHVWCMALSDTDMPPKLAKERYGKRFQTEETFRDLKDPRFGFGLRYCAISQPARRDRMLLLGVLATALLTLLGMAGEKCGLDRTLKANTAKTRQHSLMRQGSMWYDLIPNMREDRLRILMAAYYEIIVEQGWDAVLGVTS